jgi:hypothetical protein
MNWPQVAQRVHQLCLGGIDNAWNLYTGFGRFGFGLGRDVPLGPAPTDAC